MLYAFSNFVLDTGRRELRDGEDLVRVEPQVFDLLEYLIHHRDRVVTRDDLFGSIWKGRIVSDATLSSRISAARAAIGDTGTEQRLIRTLPRKGLRFVGAIREAAGEPGAPAVTDSSETGETRKIAVILATDIAGYSRLAGSEEDRTLARLRTLRSDLIDPVISVHRGRIVKRTGDGALVEFRSTVEAVRCALEVQTGMLERNVGVPEDRRIALRMGIHVGDVVEETDGDLMGDAVNVAARLEGLCAPGSLVLSEDAYRQVRDRIAETFVDLGEQVLRNIARPVRVFGHASLSPGAGSGAHASPLALPARPSIAVLPFQNMSSDAEQDYFADGIVEDITTRLSRIKWLFVIARNSAFTYKGRAIDIRQVARELGVRYVVEGSVRKAGTRVRITGQLIQAETGQHIWANHFDGELADIFELQDQVTSSLVAAVEPSLRQAEIERALGKPTEHLDAYDHYLRALPHFYTLTQDGMGRAIALLEQAIAVDPAFALAKAFVARCYAWRNPQGWAAAPDLEKMTAIRLGREALAEGGNDPSVLWMVGFVKWQLRIDFDGALDLYERSLAINPNCAPALTVRGWALAWAGRSQEAVPSLLQALRLSPLDPEAFFTMSALGCAYMLTGSFEDGLKWTTRALRERPGFAPSLRFHAICLARLGRSREARETIDHLLELEPGLGLALLERRAPIFHATPMAFYLDSLREAGMPD
ncbi:winged helix-turn-helix domain-containing protein [Methylobacterium durans]|uniref:winged helix-turn-helix domain-containing protein n=1 Tax=Methylobacterium durans TaxID=2202825 RepID=UPI0013A54733|nr:winged helix-turn-helix domain-containing protein [Methylobacterium durans]